MSSAIIMLFALSVADAFVVHARVTARTVAPVMVTNDDKVR